MAEFQQHSFAGVRTTVKDRWLDQEENNEDSVCVSKDCGVVLDGATGLHKEKVTREKTDAKWFSYNFRTYLQAMLNGGKSVSDIVRDGIAEVDKRYMRFPGAEQVKSKPSSGAAVFRIRKEMLSYFILGDCSIFVIFKDGSFQHIALGDLSKLDAANIDRMVKIAAERKINVIEARPLINDFLIEARNKMNKPGGYWILSDNLQAADNALTGELEINNIACVLAMSDGFSQIFDTLNIYTKQQFADKVMAGESLVDMCEQIKQVQNEDNTCNRFPRFKVSDDMSVIMLKL